MGVHRQDRAAVLALGGLALAQLAWGALALRRRGGPLAVAGVVLGTVAVGGWVLAKTGGISFVAGLEEVEPIQWSDATAAALALAAGVGALRHLAVGAAAARPPRPSVARAAVVVLTVAAMAAMVTAPGHAHGDHDAEHTAHGPGARAAAPYDPRGPIDLSGAAGVGPEEQARAEDLVRRTVAVAPRFADRAAVALDGWASVGDAASGYEHRYRPEAIDDDVALDPEEPEGLVYAIDDEGTATLAGVLYLLPPRTPVDDAPELGGALTVWTLRRDLCVGSGAAPEVARSDATGTCPTGTTALAPVPELPVWVVANECGPFQAPSLTGEGC